ncbi:MAG: TOPRIM nucleotidyl transferase/hydrolase domain-containing protein [Euzebya sp.]
MGLTAVVLVEGVSDQVAVESLAARYGRDLTSEGVQVIPMGGAMGIGRFLGQSPGRVRTSSTRLPRMRVSMIRRPRLPRRSTS